MITAKDIEELEKKTLTSRKLFVDANEFSQYIEKIAITNNNTCLSALVEYCETNMVDFDSIASMVSQSLKDKLEVEFAAEGMLTVSPSLYDMHE